MVYCWSQLLKSMQGMKKVNQGIISYSEIFLSIIVYGFSLKKFVKCWGIEFMKLFVSRRGFVMFVVYVGLFRCWFSEQSLMSLQFRMFVNLVSCSDFFDGSLWLQYVIERIWFGLFFVFSRVLLMERWVLVFVRRRKKVSIVVILFLSVFV